MAYYSNDDTIFAPATVPGTGAISLIRVSGRDALRIADEIVKCGKERGPIASAPGYTIRFGSIYSSDGGLLDEVLVSVFHAPRSYTGEDLVEISCHASSYIVGELSALLSAAGARPAEAGEFTRRAFLNGKMDLTQAEAVADVIASQSAAAHRVAVNQMKGGFSSQLREVRSQLLKIVSLMELELDFSEEEVEFADRRELVSLSDRALAHVNKLADSFRLGNAIKNGVPTAIVGATNVGKSTLLNALLGEDRAIVSDVHGTTRDTIEEVLNLDGVFFRFIDTAGLRETSETVERIGIERTRQKVAEAEIVLGLVDVTRGLPEIQAEVKEVMGLVDPTRQTVFVVLNKIDVGNKVVNDLDKVVSYIENKGVNALSVSAKAGEGLDGLREALVASQKGRIDNSGAVLVTNARHYKALHDAASSLERVRKGILGGLPTDLVAQDIRETIDIFGTIVGEISTDEVLGSIFQNFCIGK